MNKNYIIRYLVLAVIVTGCVLVAWMMMEGAKKPGDDAVLAGISRGKTHWNEPLTRICGGNLHKMRKYADPGLRIHL